MNKKQLILISVLIIALISINVSAQQCGDVNDDGNVNALDGIDFVKYLFLKGTTPAAYENADINQCQGVDVLDLYMLNNYALQGTPEPCQTSINCELPTGGIIVLDHVDGLLNTGIIGTGRSITFYFRFVNNTGQQLSYFTNGFNVSSPDGAMWWNTSLYFEPSFTQYNFKMGLYQYGNKMLASQDNTNIALCALGGLVNDGIPPGYDDIAFTISIGPLDEDDVGATIIIDTVSQLNELLWSCSKDGVTNFSPEWGGPYSFVIGESFPDTLTSMYYSNPNTGGNGHWYGVVSIVQSWQAHNELIQTLEYNGMKGHLATINTSSESFLIRRYMLDPNTDQPSLADEFFLGGHGGGGWHWVTDENWSSYQYWRQGGATPGGGDALAIFGASNNNQSYYWFNMPDDTIGSGSFNERWAIVEFEPNEPICGDVNGDSGIDPGDLIYLMNFIVNAGPPPDFQVSNVNKCIGTDVLDISYLVNYIFHGGPEPCNEIVNCAPPNGGMINIEEISGIDNNDQIMVGEEVYIDLNYNNNTSQEMKTISNCFRISSPEGLNLSSLAAIFDSTIVSNGYFDLVRDIDMRYDVNNNRVIIEIVGLGINSGLHDLFDGGLIHLKLGPFTENDIGKTIVVEKYLFNIYKPWVWSSDGINSFDPEWGGNKVYSVGQALKTRFSLYSVDGSNGTGQIYAETPIAFNLRIENNTGTYIKGMTNGFKIYSPDNAHWVQAWGDTIGTVNHNMFDLVFGIIDNQTNGLNVDTIGFGGSVLSKPGMPDGFDEVAYRINIGPISSSYIGKTICIDSSFYPPTGVWKWAGNGVYYPEWDGPHCFEIAASPVPSKQKIILDRVDGGLSNNRIGTNTPIKFYFRFQNNGLDAITGLTNGFKVYSPDGARWGSTSADTIGAFGKNLFDLVTSIQYFGNDGQGIDTVGLGAVSLIKPGMVPGYDEEAFSITVGPIDPIYDGKTICIDSTYFPPTGYWIWASPAYIYNPSWSGPFCFTVDDVPPPEDTLMNLVQWPVSEGGNNHWYALYTKFMYWDDAEQKAPLLTHDNAKGYLATILSSGENDFVLSNVLVGTQLAGYDDQYWLGGKYIEPDWVWLTGEPFVYTNWAVGEPNNIGIETVLSIWGHNNSYRTPGTWNNSLPNGSVNTLHQYWSVIEWDSPPISTDADSLIIPGVTVNHYDGTITVQSKTSQPIRGASIPIEIPADVYITSLSSDGYITDDWDLSIYQIKPDSGFIMVVLANTIGEDIPPGITDLFDINFKTSRADCESPMSIIWDTALAGQPPRQLTFADVYGYPVFPGFDVNRDITSVNPYTPGEMVFDGLFDIGDLVYMVDALYHGGEYPLVENSMDVNGDCLGPDISDIVYMVNYQFMDGPSMQCGCIIRGAKNNYLISSAVEISSSIIDDQTIVYLDNNIDLRGVEIVVRGQSENKPTNLIENQFDMLYGTGESGLKIGLLDLDGANYLSSGKQPIIELEGEYEIISAVVTDMSIKSLEPVISGKGVILPDEFELSQNYPNPFNPVTSINLSLPQSINAKLKIYNVMGQEVFTLYDGQLPVGEHSFTWDASDYSSGVYFYKLESAEFKATKKMILLK